MNRNIILIALLGLLSIGKVTAQSVTVEAKIDSLQILIGEQAKLQLQVAMDARQRAIFPAYADTLIKGVEIIEGAVCADHVHMCVSIPENKHFKFYGISEREKYANDI